MKYVPSLFQGRELKYTGFSKVPRSYRDCSGFKIPKYREEWYDVSCTETYRFCAACHEREPLILKMRGLCEDSLDATFFKMVDQYGEMPWFKSFTRYNIVYDKNGTWLLFDCIFVSKTIS
ncbi:hypothetical protein SK128_012578 [Halocaridina rubra]|uniref:Uncharacterized protein n=1 Tax=Halocaridina rubra TaxID=373956 RepID=A0AAN8WBQ4_HALRR